MRKPRWKEGVNRHTPNEGGVKRLPRFSAIVRLFTLVNVPFSILHLI